MWTPSNQDILFNQDTWTLCFVLMQYALFHPWNQDTSLIRTLFLGPNSVHYNMYLMYVCMCVFVQDQRCVGGRHLSHQLSNGTDHPQGRQEQGHRVTIREFYSSRVNASWIYVDSEQLVQHNLPSYKRDPNRMDWVDTSIEAEMGRINVSMDTNFVASLLVRTSRV